MPLPKNENRSDEERRAHCEKMKRYYERHPEQRQKCVERIMNRYYTDAAYRETVKERSRLRRLRLKEEKIRASEVELDGFIPRPEN